MKALKKPCHECPFAKKSLKGYLGGVYETPMELHLLVMSEKPFTCHVAQGDVDVTWDKAGSEEFPLCAGALLYMKKGCKSPREPELKNIMEEIVGDKSQLENILSVPEFIQHHSK